MLARTYGPKYSRFPCYVQPKLNGVRALYQSGTFQSRDEKIWKLGVMTHLVTELLTIAHITGGRILDGELYKHNWKLQRINGAIAVNRNEPNDDTKQVEYHIFDTVNPDATFSERWIDLANAMRTAPLRYVKIVDTSFVLDREQLDRYFHMATAEGYEGVMLRPDGKYEFGETPHGTQKRSDTLWKYKQWEDAEFMCVGTTAGEGKADIGIGALILAAVMNPAKLTLSSMQADDMPTFKVGTGFSDEERIEYAKNPPIGKLVRVRYLCLTEDGIPFNPSFLCVMS